MTSERKKAVLFLSITLIVGILIGSLVPAFFGRMRRENWKERGKVERRDGKRPDRRVGFEKMIYRVIKADSDQVKQIRPILNETATKIEALEKGSNDRMIEIVDSMNVKLKTILTEEQAKNLEEFHQKMRAKKRGGIGR